VQRRDQTFVLKPHRPAQAVTGPGRSLREDRGSAAQKMIELMVAVVIAVGTGMVIHTVWFR
jgi:hypothetical protein